MLAIDRHPQEYRGCVVVIKDPNGNNGEKNIGMIVDYDANTKQYEIFLEGNKAEFTYGKICFTIMK